MSGKSGDCWVYNFYYMLRGKSEHPLCLLWQVKKIAANSRRPIR